MPESTLKRYVESEHRLRIGVPFPALSPLIPHNSRRYTCCVTSTGMIPQILYSDCTPYDFRLTVQMSTPVDMAHPDTIGSPPLHAESTLNDSEAVDNVQTTGGVSSVSGSHLSLLSVSDTSGSYAGRIRHFALGEAQKNDLRSQKPFLCRYAVLTH